MNPLDPLYLAFAMLSFLSGLLFSALFLALRELRKGPGSIVLGQCFAQMILDLHWLTMDSIYRHDNSAGCRGLGFVGVFAYVLAFNYAVAMKHLLLYHSFSLSTAFIISFVFYMFDYTGTSTISTCFIKKRSNAE